MQLRELTERYQLQRILKSTGSGTVLEAIDVSSGTPVVVKLVTAGTSPGLAAAAPEFEKLARTLAWLGHPNLPVVLDFGFTLVLFSRSARAFLVPMAVLAHLGILLGMNIAFLNVPQLLVFVDWEALRSWWRARAS